MKTFTTIYESVCADKLNDITVNEAKSTAGKTIIHQNQNFGTLGTATKLKDSTGRALKVGDIVRVKSAHGMSFVFPVVQTNDKVFVKGLTAEETLRKSKIGEITFVASLATHQLPNFKVGNL